MSEDKRSDAWHAVAEQASEVGEGKARARHCCCCHAWRDGPGGWGQDKMRGTVCRHHHLWTCVEGEVGEDKTRVRRCRRLWMDEVRARCCCMWKDGVGEDDIIEAPSASSHVEVSSLSSLMVLTNDSDL